MWSSHTRKFLMTSWGERHFHSGRRAMLTWQKYCKPCNAIIMNCMWNVLPESRLACHAIMHNVSACYTASGYWCHNGEAVQCLPCKFELQDCKYKSSYLLKHYIQSVSGCGNCLVPPLLSDLFMNNNSARLHLALLLNMHMILIQVFF